MTTSNRYRIIGYGVCGPNERYLENTLKEFKRLCDHTVILCNNTDEESIKLIKSYGFDVKYDDREWGLNQHKIKEEFVVGLSRYKPDWLVCLDMDEVFDENFTREKLEEYAGQCDSMYVYIVNLWNDGWKKKLSFWNIRIWKWNGIVKFANRPLHCGLAPEWAYHYGSYVPIILNHYGLKDKDKRMSKVERYKKYDPEAKYRDSSYYDMLQSDTCDELDYSYVQKEIEKESLPIKRKKIHSQNKEVFYYVRSKEGKVMDIPAKNLVETLKRGFVYLGVVGEESQQQKRIAYIGKFNHLYDEEYIAKSFESVGIEVLRINETDTPTEIVNRIYEYRPDFVLVAKFRVTRPDYILKMLNERNIPTVCWVFDLYFGYEREYQIKSAYMFQTHKVFSTDGGHQEEWKNAGIKHDCVRQGIYKPECVLFKDEKEHDVVFVGSFNPYNTERNEIIDKIKKDFSFKWFGKRDTNEVRGLELNKLYAKTKIVIGDSVYSPHYWSNRVVETLGRGGFLIHMEVEGIKEEYPHLVTYKRGDYQDLKSKIEYYLTHDEEREEIIKKNYEWVLNNHTCEHKVKELYDKASK